MDFFIKRLDNYNILITDIVFSFSIAFAFSNIPKKRKDVLFFILKMLAALICLWVMAGVIQQINNIFSKPAYLLIVPIVLYLVFLCKFKPKTRIVIGTIFYSSAVLIGNIAECMGFLFYQVLNFEFYKLITPIILVLGLGLTLTLLKKFDVNHFENMKFRNIGFILLVGIIAITCSFVYDNLIYDNSNISLRIFLIVISASLYVIEYAAYIVFFTLTKSHNEKLAKQAMVSQRDANVKTLEAMNATYSEMRALRHELRNQYSYMATLLSQGNFENMKAFFEKAISKFNGDFQYLDCGNHTINNILNLAIGRAKENKIKLETKIAVPEKMGIHENDLCSLLLNLTDNAIEACMKSNMKEIDLSIKKQDNFILIRVENPLPEAVSKEEILSLATRKPDKKYHGYGIKIIDKIAAKYEGSTQFKVESGVFVADVLLQEKDFGGDHDR